MNWVQRVPRALAMCVLLASIAAVLVTTLSGPTKDDIAWLLYVAQQWLHGGRLYVDIVEVNPPLIVWIYAIPAALAELTRLPAAAAAIPFFCAIVLACAGWATAILARPGTRIGDPFIVFTVCGTVLLLIPGIEFGQREHLLVAAALPYLAVVARELAGDAPGPATAIAAAIIAALGCALKPRYVVAFGFVEAYAIWRGLRVLRPATIAAASTFALYALAVLVFDPAFFRAAIPMAFALYGATDVPALDLLLDCWVILFALAVGFVLLTTQPMSDSRGRLPTLLLVFATGALIECVMQGKNWFYHRLPATIAAILCLTVWAALRLRADWRPGWRVAGRLSLAGLVLAVFGLRAFERLSHEMSIALDREQTASERLIALIHREHARSYMAFSDWIGLGFPVVNNTGVVWGSRFDSMWAVDGELWRAARDGHAPPDWPMRRWVSTDFQKTCPDLVVVDRRSPRDYVALIGHADPAFLAVWRRYERIAAFDGLVVFRRVRAKQDGAGAGCHAAKPLRG